MDIGAVGARQAAAIRRAAMGNKNRTGRPVRLQKLLDDCAAQAVRDHDRRRADPRIGFGQHADIVFETIEILEAFCTWARAMAGQTDCMNLVTDRREVRQPVIPAPRTVPGAVQQQQRVSAFQTQRR
jgi:hypothetical protein